MNTYFEATGTNTTPFNRDPDKVGYDQIIGMQNQENKTWRKIALLSIVAFFVSLFVVFYALNLPKTVPLVVTVSDWGEAKYVGDVSNFSYDNIKVPDIAVKFQIKRFIENMTTISSDAQVMKNNIKDCYKMLTQDAASKLNIQLKVNNPFEDFGTFKKTTQIETMLKLSNQTYQIDFVVKKTSMQGGVLEKIRYRALISYILLEPPKNQKIDNPLGIYISDFDLSPIQNTEKL